MLCKWSLPLAAGPFQMVTAKCWCFPNHRASPAHGWHCSEWLQWKVGVTTYISSCGTAEHTIPTPTNYAPGSESPFLTGVSFNWEVPNYLTLTNCAMWFNACLFICLLHRVQQSWLQLCCTISAHILRHAEGGKGREKKAVYQLCCLGTEIPIVFFKISIVFCQYFLLQQSKYKYFIVNQGPKINCLVNSYYITRRRKGEKHICGKMFAM